MLNNLNIKKISIWLSVTMVACFAIATLLFYQIDIKDIRDNKYQFDVNEQQYFASEDVKSININSFISNINVIDYDDTKVKVHVYGKLYSKNKNKENSPVIELIDGKLNITENRKSAINVGINFNIGELFHRNEMKIDVFIPKGYSESLKVTSSSGDVEADPLTLKELDIDTFSGNIKLKDVKADTINLETSSGNMNTGDILASELKIKSFSGDNSFKALKAEEVYFENSSGNLSFNTIESESIKGSTFSGDITAKEEFISDAIDISTSSGNIRIAGATVKKVKCETFSGEVTFDKATFNDVEIETSSGDVSLKLLEGSEFALLVDSSSGDISCDFPISTIEKQGEHELKGVVGIATNKLKIDTFSGDVKISK